MTQSLSQSQPVSPRSSNALANANPSEGRAALILLFGGAAFWLFVSSILALLASLKFHMPGLLADVPWLTYGRVYPAHWNALIYGFGVSCGLGAALWALARIGSTRIMVPGFAAVGAFVWHLGVLLAVAGILHGDSTGFEWLEVPHYASPILFVAYALVGIAVLVTSSHRRGWELSVPQWFIIASVFWFPWVFSTANMLLVFFPVRGVVQAVVNWWYISNLKICFVLLGLGILFHFFSAAVARPVRDRSIALFAFWLFVFVAPWTGIPANAPLPAWISTLSTVASVLVLIPVVALVMVFRQTLGDDCAKTKQTLGLKFMRIAFASWLLWVLLSVAMSIPQVALVTNYTWLHPAVNRLFLFGFFGMIAFGVVTEIAPGLSRRELFCPKAARLQFVTAGLGLLLYFVPLAICGFVEGMAMANPTVPFAQVMQKTLMFIRISTLGEVLILVASACFLVNLLRVCRGCCGGSCDRTEAA